MTRAGAAVLVALVLAGCGTEVRDDRPRLARDAFVTQANAICDELKQKTVALWDFSDFRLIPDFVDRVMPDFVASQRRLQALRPPEELDDEYERVLDSIEDVREIFVELKQAVVDKNAGGLERAADKSNGVAKRNREAAQAAGLEDCVFAKVT